VIILLQQQNQTQLNIHQETIQILQPIVVIQIPLQILKKIQQIQQIQIPQINLILVLQLLGEACCP